MDRTFIALIPTLAVLISVFGVGYYNIHALRGKLIKTSGRILHATTSMALLGLFLRYGPRPTHVVTVQYSYQVNGKTFIGHGKKYFVGSGPARDYVEHHPRFTEITIYRFDSHPQDSRLVNVVPKTAAYITAALAIFAIGVIGAIVSTF